MDEALDQQSAVINWHFKMFNKTLEIITTRVREQQQVMTHFVTRMEDVEKKHKGTLRTPYREDYYPRPLTTVVGGWCFEDQPWVRVMDHIVKYWVMEERNRKAVLDVTTLRTDGVLDLMII